jgi:hypothetical protein
LNGDSERWRFPSPFDDGNAGSLGFVPL